MYDDGGKRQYPDPVIIEEDRPNSGSSLNGGDQSEYKETLNGGDQSEYGTKFSNFLDKLTGNGPNGGSDQDTGGGMFQKQIDEWFNDPTAMSAEDRQAWENQMTRDYNAAEAQKTREWETEMSNTSWQRGMADMQAAGLNPALAYQQGGAGTPNASSAHSSASGTANSNPKSLFVHLTEST